MESKTPTYILVVDDDPKISSIVSDMLELLEFKVFVANSPRLALIAIRKMAPAMILLDFNMPGVDGLEVIKYMKRDPLSADIPVVFLTAEDDPSVKEKAMAAGAFDFLIKPLEFDQLESLLKRLPIKK